MKPETLTEAQVNRAYRLFYGEGMTLRMIMAELGCGLYALTPWLTAPAARIAAAAIEDERAFSAGRQALAEREGQDGSH